MKTETHQDRWLYRVKRWMYPQNKPNALARGLNHVSAVQFATGVLAPRRAVTLEVAGRRTGRPVSYPLVLVEHEGGRYLVSMLGPDAGWVRNVRAAGGRAVLRHGRRQIVRLAEVDVAERAPILRRFVDVAPGARPHVPVDQHAPLSEFTRIADQFPVFRVTTTPAAGPADGPAGTGAPS